MARKNASKKIAAPQVERIEPTAAEIAGALATIDEAQETAVVAGIVDHHTQLGSWHGADTTSVFDQVMTTTTFESPEDAADVMFDADYADREFGSEHLMPIAGAETGVAAPTPEFSGDDSLEPPMPLYGLPTTLTKDVIEASAGNAPEPQAPDEAVPLGWPPGWDKISPEDEAPATEPSFDDLVKAQEDALVEKSVYFLSKELEGREAFETSKSAETGLTNIFRTLKKVRAQMVTKRAAAVLNAVRIDPAFINRALHDGSRYNVYALGKLSDIIYGVSGGAVSNEINLAVIRSLFKCREADIPFTKEVAKACCSKNIPIAGGIGAKLVRYTVSPSTAPTQASSTMQALVTLGVVDALGSSRNPTYVLKDAPITRKLEGLLLAA